MNGAFKKVLSITLLAAMCTAFADNDRDTFGKPFFVARSQGENLARRLVGEVHELYPCLNCFNGIISFTPEYSRTFNSKQLGKYFSFREPSEDCTEDEIKSYIMRFRGSNVGTPAERDVLAENFLLASDFNSDVALKPRVENFILDINARFNMDNVLCGLYFEIGLPIVRTDWDMRLEECGPINQGTTIDIAAANAPAVEPFKATAPFNSIINAWKGLCEDTTLPFTSATGGLPDNPININIEKLKFARIDGKQKEWGLAEVIIVLGRNYICDECSHFGMNIRVAVPTGTRPKAEFVFEPIVGSGRHARIGGGMSGHIMLWEDNCDDSSFSMWFDSAIYHLFQAKQKRTFDLRGNGVGSRYLLFKKFTDGQFLAGDTGTLVLGPNVTTRDAKVKINVAGEAVILFDYQQYGMTLDFGYNIWGRSKESITLDEQIPEDTFGLLGDTPIDSNMVPNAANRTNSTVKINGENSNAAGDNPSPVFVKTDDLDTEAAEAPSAFSHKFFAHLGYTFEGCYYAPFMGIGGEAEFSGNRNNAFDQWGVWAKFGVAFS